MNARGRILSTHQHCVSFSFSFFTAVSLRIPHTALVLEEWQGTRQKLPSQTRRPSPSPRPLSLSSPLAPPHPPLWPQAPRPRPASYLQPRPIPASGHAHATGPPLSSAQCRRCSAHAHPAEPPSWSVLPDTNFPLDDVATLSSPGSSQVKPPRPLVPRARPHLALIAGRGSPGIFGWVHSPPWPRAGPRDFSPSLAKDRAGLWPLWVHIPFPKVRALPPAHSASLFRSPGLQVRPQKP